MGPHVWRRWPLNLIFVLIHCSTNIGFQHGASVAAAEKPVSVDFDSEGIASKVLFVGRTIFAPIMWAKNNVKVSQDTGPFLLQNIKNNFVDNGWKEKKKKKRHKRSYRVNQRHGYHEDNFQLSSSIPADFILVVVLGNPVNRASLFWLQHAFEKQLNLPLDNIGIFRTSYNIVELFFIKDDPPESDKFLDNLIPVKDIMNGTLLHNIQQRAPLLNVSDIHPQHPLVISHYTSIFWMESYFPYLAAAGIVAFVLLLTVMIYCCCKRRQKIIITEKEPQQKQQQQQQQIFYPTIAPNMKDPMMIQPEGSPVFVTKGCVTQVQTQTTRIKSKGLLESRRGSSASLTLDLNASPEMNRWDGGTPPKESSCLEYMLSAGNRLSRRDLRNSIKNNRALYQEFWEIPMNIPEKVHIAGSGMKNRYKTIIPNEFTRVILPDNEWDPLSSYINANYVRGYEGETRAYIATQGPMSHTIVDFWRMVWVEKSPIIVMITKLKEKNKPKCENYLPEDYKSCTFGKIEVKADSVIVKGGYTLRHLYLKCNGEIQHVLHYWYTAWPDHKPPESPTMLLGLVKEVELHRYRGQGYRKTGPVIVHCSAGIGRTGCFIAISIGMRQLREEHSVDVLGTVCSMRLDRGGTIQTHEQYAFIHQALCEYEKELAEPVTNYSDD